MLLPLRDQSRDARLLARLLFLFTVLPLIELALLVWIGTKTSAAVSIAIVVVAGVAGALLARSQGWQTATRLRADLAAGRMPADALLDGILIFAAAVLLIAPGVLSDLMAIVLLIPATRKLVKRYVGARLRARVRVEFFGGAPPAHPEHDEVIDVKVIRPVTDDRR